MSAAVDSGRVPNEIRRSLQLVRVCHQDLERLIDLRHQHLALLQTKPGDLEQVNRVISEVKGGLAEASRIVEKCRPEAHTDSKTPLRKRLAWILSDSLLGDRIGDDFSSIVPSTTTLLCSILTYGSL
ncbi:hypothetical protein HRG_008999 [Hirsutella rhossiliensis]|uniref:Uncharacterized protein n=1 Tax=Hirsutella rhossiliensis TaxID=111463 RepID=A0A9P8MQM5_9HYPO|nr:uncharacterized protein HRG_08999 [Hirsutella rhossiliensis]KAH0959978.1 hypothetical protein HRG_08999 [Hirsutella rhossiliensis]